MKQVSILAVGLTVVLALALGNNSAWAGNVPRKGLIGEWLFAGNADDSSGNGYNGDVQGATLTKDRFGRARNAYDFNGNARIDTTITNINTTTGSKVTLSYWMYWEGADNSMPIAWNTLQLYLWNNNWFTFNISHYGDYGMSSFGLANRWVHVGAIINNGDATKNKLFIDGVAMPPLLLLYGSLGPYNLSPAMAMGGWTGGGYNFVGKIDDVRIYNRALSTLEVTALSHEGPEIGSCTAWPSAGSAPLNVNFTCGAASPYGPISQYRWDVNGDGTDDALTTTGSYLCQYSANGTYKARVRVVDSTGFRVTSADMPVKVGNGPEVAGRTEYYQFDNTAKTAAFKVRVYNSGNAAAGPFKVNFSVSDNGVGPKVFKTVAVPGLAAGANTLLNVSKTFTESIHGRLITIAVDSGKKVVEVDETNNSLQIYVGQPLPK